jgi:hypothetical protein
VDSFISTPSIHRPFWQEDAERAKRINMKQRPGKSFGTVLCALRKSSSEVIGPQGSSKS